MAETLFPLPDESIRRPNWGEYARTVAETDAEIIRWIIRLYVPAGRFDLDPTYSTGQFWRGLPKPRLRMDIYPQAEGVVQADARALPLASDSISSIMFDPPFVVAPKARPGIIRDRFGVYPNVPALWAFYADALREFRRVLVDDGVVAFKCQDILTGSTQYMTHAAVIAMAQQLGFYVRDLFILYRRNVLWSPNMANQQHARKTHSYYLVLVKREPPEKTLICGG